MRKHDSDVSKKYEDIIKGDNNTDSHTKKYIHDLEKALTEAKKALEQAKYSQA